jgi:hypothetical protein
MDMNFLPQWEALIQADTHNDMVIVAGLPHWTGQAEPEYTAVIQQARQKGIQVLAYVQTLFGERSQEDVIGMINDFYAWYELDGVFIDEIVPSDQDLGYYQAIVAASRQESDHIVVLNPGGTASRDYVDMADMIVTFEGSYERYIEYQVPDFMLSYPPERFIHLVHTTPADSFGHALELSQDRNVSWVYVTDDGLPNAFHRLPTYWNDQINAVNGTC